MWRSPDTVLGSQPGEPAEPGTDEGRLAATTVAPVATPDFVGLSLMEARRQARLVGFHVEVLERTTVEDEWGQVLAQEPAAGSAPGRHASVSLTVGVRPHVRVPDVRGRSEDDALAVLRAAGFTSTRRVVRKSDKVPEGHVVRTRPRAGSQVPAGSRISYVLADAPRPTGRERHSEKHRVRAVRMPDGSFGRRDG
jgi:serine/threonine-protein kinase